LFNGERAGKRPSFGASEVATTLESYTPGLQNIAVQDEATLFEYHA
jgi:hypothetical protein